MSENPPTETGDPRDDALWPAVYDELRAMAAAYLRDRPLANSLQPTMLVNEAYVRLQNKAEVNDREHFKALAASVMRCVLVDYVRERNAQKRGGDWARVTLEGIVADLQAREIGALELDEALTKLAKLSPRQAKVVELRVFGGLDVPETARVLSCGVTTVKEDWRFATAWLQRALAS